MSRPRKHPLPSIARLHQLFDYDPETGHLIHRERDPSTAQARGFNARFGGKPAGTVMNVGYVFVRVDCHMHLGHRVAWAMYYGRWPSEIDHIDGNKLNNAISNLREATRSQNSSNRPSRNKTGMKGVHVYKRAGGRSVFSSRIAFQNRIHNLGQYETAEEAHEAYKAAAKRLHGDFANVSATPSIVQGSINATIRFAQLYPQAPEVRS